LGIGLGDFVISTIACERDAVLGSHVRVVEERGSKESATPKRRAVSGISCIRPRAPLEDTASASKSDSVWMMARIRSTLTPCTEEAASMCWL